MNERQLVRHEYCDQTCCYHCCVSPECAQFDKKLGVWRWKRLLGSYDITLNSSSQYSADVLTVRRDLDRGILVR